jgi:glycerol-3-phosphate acyltransferase PlsY
MVVLIDNVYVFYTLVAMMGYLLGSIPSGLILARLMGAGDLRQIGSGNIGATNALRTGNKKLALFTLLCDALKGVLAVWIAYELNIELAEGEFYYVPVFAGFAAVIGHVFPVWLKFKGGKGVATAWGVLCSLHWPTGLGCLITWLIVARLSRYSSLAAIMAAFNAPLFAMAYHGKPLALPFAGLSILLFITHRANVRRLMKGEESTIKLSSKA